MKKILMVGESDILLENIYDCLSAKYKIQICEPVDATIIRMNKIIKPNLIMIIKSSGISNELLTSIKYKILDIPIVCICAEGDPIANKLCRENMHFLFRPINNNALIEKVGELTGETMEEQSLETFDGLFAKKEKRQILAIDDNPMVLRGLKQLLDVEYAVTVVTSVKAAKVQVEKTKYDLILLDYEMPEIDGLEAYKYFVGNPYTEGVPVIFLTGVSDTARIKEVVTLNPKPAGYLLKPIDADVLKDTIRKILN